PFLHSITLQGPKGEQTRVRALFDDGAMVGAMCSSIFHAVKHRLHNWNPSKQRLRMANGTVIRSEACWQGTIEIGNVRAEGTFEVFNSGGGWAFLFGKPLLTAFNAIHDYRTDQIVVSDTSNTATIRNELRSERHKQVMGTNLTLDVKQRAIAEGGENPPARRV
ncbi:hypothetical protein HYDPIDRAFT_59664, partial [Hydnomerulius pinastri MD-312]